MFRYDYIKNLPEVFTNYFVANNQIHHHNTRNASKLHKPYKRTNYVKHTLSNKGVDIWNGLDFNIKNIKCYNIYRRETKFIFLTNLIQLVSNNHNHYIYIYNIILFVYSSVYIL